MPFKTFAKTHCALGSLTAACLLGALVTLSACGPKNDTVKPNGVSTVAPTSTVAWPKAQSPFSKENRTMVGAKANAILAKMSLRQKVAQMTQANIDSITPDEVHKYQIGSVLVGGGAFLNGDKTATADQWLAQLDKYHAAADTTALGIPLMWGVDAVHGHNKIYGATLFPHNIGLGATNNLALVKTVSEITAKQVIATGFDWTFSPSVSVVRDDRWGRTYESFAEQPGLVARVGAASILGYQGEVSDTGLLQRDHIVATAKHFIGDGGTEGGIDRGDTKASEAELAALHAPGYQAAIEAGVLTIMASHNSWQGLRLHGHDYLLNTVLKGQMGFEGFVIGDWNSHALVDGCSNDHCPQAVNAGVDMFMVPNDWKAFIDKTVADVEAGRITQARIDDATSRILQVKIRAGLFTAPKPSKRSLAGQTQWLNGDKTKMVARQAVRESAVLLKNNQNTLPLHPKQKVLVTGPGAHNIPMQNGGWTISWQSTDTTNKDFPNATSIFQGVERAVTAAGGSVELSETGTYKTKPDVAIVAFGEPPYAEWQGDMPHLAFQAKYPEGAEILERLQKQGIKTVGIFMSGRAMWVNRELNAADAFVAAWLPGTEGDGLAQLLFTHPSGKAAYDFTGRLPFSWPKDPAQSPLNPEQSDYAPLFKVGYGLDYSASSNLAALPAAFSLSELNASQTDPFFVGTAVSPWEVHLQAPGKTPVRYLSGLAKNTALTVIEADKETQGDSLGGRWSGDGEATLALFNPGAYRDFNDWNAQGGAIVFDARLLKPSNKPIYFAMANNRKTDAVRTVDLTTLVNTSPVNDWNSLSVALNCFNDPAFLATARQVFGLQTEGALEVDIANVRIEPNMADKAGVNCQ